MTPLSEAWRRVHPLLAVVGALALLTLVGMIALWPAPRPAPDPAQVAPPLLEGTIRAAEEIPCVTDEFAPVPPRPPCLELTVEVGEGEEAGSVFTVDTGEQGLPPLQVGERVQIGVSQGPEGETAFYVQDQWRLDALGWVVGLFVVAVLAVGRTHGLRSLLGLAASLLIVVRFVVPAILDGSSPVLVALVGAFAILLIAVTLTHGVSLVTGTALTGTAAALILTVALGAVFTAVGDLTGLSSEDAQFVRASVADVDVRGLVLAGLVISALGVLDDVTVTQASTVLALHRTDPSLSVRGLVARAMSVGRDHIAATVNTLVLAYVGASLPLLLLFATGGVRVGELLNAEILAEEVVKTLIGSIGLVAAVPFTTVLAAVFAARSGAPARATPVAGTDRVEEADDDWLRSLRGGGGHRH